MRILFLPEYHGEETSERTPQLIKILKGRHELVFIPGREHWIRKRAFWPLRAWERLQLFRTLIQEGKRLSGIDLVFCRDYMNAFPGLKIARHLRVPCVWDSEGSMKDFWETTHSYPAQVLPWAFLEGWLAKRVDYMTTVTENDKKAYIRQGMSPEKIHILPICTRPELGSSRTKEEARRELGYSLEERLFFFFAQFDYPPNQKALRFLNEEVAPVLPGKLLVCGKGRCPKRWHPNVRYLGFLPLPRLYDILRACDVGLAPIWEANGSLTKVIDMLSHGTPAVVTPAIQRGIPELVDGENALIARDKKDFIAKTFRLAQEDSLRKVFGIRGPEIIRKKYDWGLYEEKIFSLIEGFRQKHG